MGKVDMLFQALVLLSIFALIKFFNLENENPTHLTILRSFFLCGQCFLFILFVRARSDSKESAEDRDEVKKVFFGMMTKAMLSGGIHYFTGQLPPLLVSVAFGMFTVHENKLLYQQLHNMIPFLFAAEQQ